MQPLDRSHISMGSPSLMTEPGFKAFLDGQWGYSPHFRGNYVQEGKRHGRKGSPSGPCQTKFLSQWDPHHTPPAGPAGMDN